MVSATESTSTSTEVQRLSPRPPGDCNQREQEMACVAHHVTKWYTRILQTRVKCHKCRTLSTKTEHDSVV